MTLTVTGDCSFESVSAINNTDSIGLRCGASIKHLTINGTGTLIASGFDSGFNLISANTTLFPGTIVTITVNIPMTVNGNAAFNVSGHTSGFVFEINGIGSLYAAGERGIQLINAPIDFSGDLKLIVNSVGDGPAALWVQGSDAISYTCSFDLTNDVCFDGGSTGVGAYLTSGNNTTLIFENNGTGDIVFRGGASNGHGMYLRALVSLVSSNTGTFKINGGGRGSGIYVDQYGVSVKLLDISLLQNDLVAMGGEIAPGLDTSQQSAGLLLYIGQLLVKLGNNNLLFQGGANGGPGIAAINNLVGGEMALTVNSAGGELYALGGKGPNGCGIWSSGARPLTLSGNGTIHSYGSYQQPGIRINVGAFNLSDSIIINSIGGEGAAGFAIPNTNRITFVDNTPTLAITNNSTTAETHPFSAASVGTWDLTGATLATGAPGDANVTVSVAPGATGTIRR